MHSWSPEVADTVRQRYRPWLAAAQHDRALYFRSRPNSTLASTTLEFLCPWSGCSRTASQVLSLSRALALKQQFELQYQGHNRFSVVVVARHDLIFRSAFAVPQLWRLPERGIREVRLLSACDGKCGPAAGETVPSGCRLTGPACPVPYFPGERRTFRAHDFLFVASSRSADRVGELMTLFHEHSAALARLSHGYSALHNLLPYHILHHEAKLRLGWLDLMAYRDVQLARHAPWAAPTAAAATWAAAEPRETHPWKCARNTSLRGQHSEDVGLLQHPSILNEQCPYERALFCDCS